MQIQETEMQNTAVSYKLTEFGSPPVAVKHSIPVPKGNEVLLRVTHAGVCHSDVYIMDGFQDLGGGERIDFADTPMPMPLTMGHEVVGKISAVGEGADKNLIGEKRLIYPWIGCGECLSCKAEQENHCESAEILGIFQDGGYGDYVIVPDSKYLVEYDGIDPAWACTLACSGVTVFSALKQLLPEKPDSFTAIIGMGGLGLMAVSMARALGFDRIVACDISDDRLAIASALGATCVLNTSGEDADVALREAANNSLYGVIDTVGLPSTMELAISSTMKGGRIVLVGLQGGQITLPLPTLPFKALSLIGTYTGTLQDLRELLPLAKAGLLKPLPITLKPMACLHSALEDLRRGDVLGRVVLQPDN